MITREIEENIYIPENIYDQLKMNKVLFFDIETTGFDKDSSSVILISSGWFISKDKFFIKQYFSESLDEEKEMLLSFKEDVDKFQAWCSYNGRAFDEPFIKRRMKLNGIRFLEPSIHIDLYRKIRPYHRQLGMERCNLRSVEQYLGIDREDKIDGGLSVELYFEFLGTKDFRLREVIMLHNYEDVLNLPKVFKLIYEIENNEGLKRVDCITEKQAKYLVYLLKKNKITIDSDIKNMSQKAASRIIDNILKGNIDIDEFNNIVNSSY